MSRTTGCCRVEYACLTDVGVRRSHNQDSYAVVVAESDLGWCERGHLFLVADGMGAHAVGEMASKLAADIIAHTYFKHLEAGVPVALHRAFQEANRAIYERGQQNLDFSGMGTTATVLALHPSGAWIGHVGDTRVYRIRQGTIEQLTFDHSLRWEVARRRHEDPDKVTDIASNAIVRSLGPETTVEVDLEGPHSVQAGDVFLLCSDGLSGLVSDAEMGAIASTLPLKEAANFLVALANLRGGPDNITVILVRVQEFAPAPTCPRLPWWKRIGQGLWRWLATATPAQCARLAVPLAVLTLATLIPVLASWTELPALWRRVLLGSSIVSFVTASALLARGLYLLQKMERHSGESEPEAREQVRINPPQVYRRASCAVDGNLLGRMTQVQQDLLNLLQRSQWPYPAEAYHALNRQRQDLLRSGKSAEAFQVQLQGVALLAEAVRRQQRRSEVFLPNWNGQ
jgi:serine/threonine protein phosphatase PrpC